MAAFPTPIPESILFALGPARPEDAGVYEIMRNVALNGRTDSPQSSASIVSHYLRSPLPPANERQQIPCREERVAILALEMLDTDRGMQDEERLEPVVKKLFTSQATDLLRWASHLFTTWVLHHPRTEVNTYAQVIRSKVTETVPNILLWMTDIPDVCHLLKKDARIGPLLAEMAIVSIWERQSTLLRTVLAIRHNLSFARGDDHHWDSHFMQYLESKHSVWKWAESIVSWVRDLETAPMDHIHELSVVFGHISDCMRTNRYSTGILEDGIGNLADAFLEQKAVMITTTSIFRKMICLLESGRLGPESTEDALRGIIHNATCLDAIFEYRGSPPLSVSLNHGLLEAICRLRGIVEFRGELAKYANSVQGTFTNLLDSIRPLVVYHPILMKMDKVRYQLREAMETVSGLEDFDLAWQKLFASLNAELHVYEKFILPTHRATSNYKNPYKFCDNCKCPSMKNFVSKLGRCRTCRSGYYCSRSCQKAVWNEGHRQECRKIAAARRGEQVGGLPLLSIHERQYLQRAVFPRFQFYLGPLLTREGQLDDNARIQIDLTKFPIKPEVSVRDDHWPDMPGLLATVVYPTCRRRGGWIALSTIVRAEVPT